MGKSAKRSPETPPNPPSAATAAAAAMIEESRELTAKPPKTTIHRIDPDNGERKFVARVTTDLATEETIAKRYGPGKYSLTHMIVGENGAYAYNSHDTVIIDDTAVVEPQSVDDKPPAAGASSPAVATSNILERAMEAGVLRLLEQSNRQFDLQAAFLERLTKQTEQPRGPDLLAIVTAVSPIIISLIESRKDPTETAVALAGLISKRSDGGEQMASMFERGIALATKFGAGAAAGGGDGGMMPVVVGEGIKVLGSIIDTIVAERRAARGEPIATVGADGQPAAPPALALVPDTPPPPPTNGHMAPTADANDRVWISAARAHLPLLLSAARFMPAPSAADTIVANLTPAAFEDLLDDIEDTTAPGFAGRLAAVFPQVEGIRPEWFRELITTLLEIGSDSGEELEESKQPAGARK